MLPAVLEGRDVIGQAKWDQRQNGGFGLGVLERLDVRRFNSGSGLCPTRELADQVAKITASGVPFLMKILTLCGGCR